MSKNKTMRFGFWPNPRSDYKATKTLAQHAEATGWDGIWLADHFLPEEQALIPVHECWITMAALARDVPRVRLGTLVAGNTYRHPAVLANMVATLDNLADGRVVLGLGAGWQQNEHEAYGLDYGYRIAHHGMAVLPPANAGLKARLINAPETGAVTIYEEDGLKISAFTVPHPPITPAYGYRFDYRGRSVVISGDTKKSDRLAAAAQNADVLIHEVLQPQLVKTITDALDTAELDALSKLLTDTLDYHTTPVEAAEVANAANVDTLVFNHFAPPPPNAIAERIYMRGVKQVRPQGAVLSKDGMRITLPPKTGDGPGIIEISGE